MVKMKADVSGEAFDQTEGIELLYRSYQKNPLSVDSSWRSYFDGTKAQETGKEIKAALETLDCGRIGFGFCGWVSEEIETWLEQKIETGCFQKPFSILDKKKILHLLHCSEIFETFLHMKYPGQKRFSLEGSDTLIPILAFLLDEAIKGGLEEAVMGMSHRGRLNVMANILGKSFDSIFGEFHEKYRPTVANRMGDVRYHLGYEADYGAATPRSMHLTLAPNPSHLESVCPVVEGIVRAKQEKKKKAFALLIHGDASLSGQGVVYETLQLGQLLGYQTGGTLHVVINNQIGFTTIPRDLRSTAYCTDIARAFGAPVLYVNAEDPETCVQAAQIALEMRQKFHCDVFIEMNCYRKYGHNEGDEPAYTQPSEYQIIRQKQSIYQIYRSRLVEEGALDPKEVEEEGEEFKKDLQKSHGSIFTAAEPILEKTVSQEELFKPIPFTIPSVRLVELIQQICQIPSDFELHPKLRQLIQERLKIGETKQGVDWSLAEALAFGVLLSAQIPVRISGQDCCRGTFSQRHALWVDQKNGREYYPLAHIQEGQGDFSIYNSPLSEMAVLGFEYGYSLAAPGLTIWEAQFGDFCNGAQVIIDQYIASGEQKWGQKSKLTLFLPHGYEGQGPEHSSARMERFLALAGHQNMSIAYPSTPAQFFHLLMRQGLGPIYKPLVVFTPKGLLRHPECKSSLEELQQGYFQCILEEAVDPTPIKKLLFCTGRIYYDLREKREKEKRQEIALIRIEQLYPLDREHLQKLSHTYPYVEEWKWVQEEPENMGAKAFVEPMLLDVLPKGVAFSSISRERSATPATGSHYSHLQETEALLIKALS